MVAEEKALFSDAEAIRTDLEYMTARWNELAQPVLFELRAFQEGGAPKTAKFSPGWIDEAVDWAVSLNELGYNVYVVRNPIRQDVKGSATDEDIVAAFFLWADCDDPASAGNVKRFDGPKFSASVVTGNKPSTRVHVYWQLEQPCTDMAAWRDMQTRIAGHFNSDRAVVNPSRIMRLGGTVAYPAKHKREKGYEKFLTTIRTKYEDNRAPVSFDQMDRVFPKATTSKPSQEFDIDADPHHRTASDYADILRRARTDGQKHTGVRDLAASLAGSGVPRHMAEAIIREACPIWNENVEDLINSAYSKFYKHRDEQFVELSDEEKAAIPAALFKPWVRKDLTKIPYPEFVYSDFYARGYTSVTLAPPKVGKSMLGLAEAIDMATGRGFLTGQPREKQKVVYFNAEDDQDVIDSRVSALLSHYQIDQSEIEGWLWPTSGVDLDDFYMISGQEGVVNESLFVSIEKFIAEAGADALVFDPLQDLSLSPETNEVFRLLGQRLRRMASTTRVALGLIHHTRKIAPGVTPTIDDGRGGSALRGTARFNRLLIGMSEDEAAKAGLDNHRHYLRIADMESNLAPPSADVNRWFQKVSVQTPNGHFVGAIEPWKWPDAFDGVSKQDAARVRAEIDKMPEPPRADVRSAGWVGNIIASVLGLNITKASDKAKVKSIAAKWIETDVLRIAEGKDPRAGRSVNVVICGANNPLSEGGQK